MLPRFFRVVTVAFLIALMPTLTLAQMPGLMSMVVGQGNATLIDSVMVNWGTNISGTESQSAGGSSVTYLEPKFMLPHNNVAGSSWKDVSTLYIHACGIRSDGIMYCWGAATNGRLGNNATTTTFNRPELLAGGFDTTVWKSVSAGYTHTCAIRESDSVIYCWGAGTNGQIGNAASADVLVPTALGGGFSTTAWSKVSAGVNTTCAIRASDSQLFCWGAASKGVLGNGTTTPDVNIPTALTSTGGWNAMSWIDVAPSNARTCAIRSDGQLFCWGDQWSGQLGNGYVSTTSSVLSTPQPLSSTGGWNAMTWKSLAQGMGDSSTFSNTRMYMCAIRSDDTLYCWGDTSSTGRLGNGSSTGIYGVPTAMGGGFDTTTWKSASISKDRACAIRLTDNRLFCWGANVGDNTSTNYNIPTALTTGNNWNATEFTKVSLGGNYGGCGSCVVNNSFAIAKITAPKTGYFVYVSGMTTGNQGGLTGANAACYTRLNADTWKGKGSSNVADASKVKAWLCDSTTCNNLLPNTSYIIASTADSSAGGSGFTTDYAGIGPNNTQAWNTADHLGATTVSYFTNRAGSTVTVFSNTPNSSASCSDWTLANASTTNYGSSSGSGSTAYNRWRVNSGQCSSAYGFICYVDP